MYIDNQNATNVFNADGYNWPTGNYTVNGNVFVYRNTSSLSTILIPKLSNYGCRILVFLSLYSFFNNHIGLPASLSNVSLIYAPHPSNRRYLLLCYINAEQYGGKLCLEATGAAS